MKRRVKDEYLVHTHLGTHHTQISRTRSAMFPFRKHYTSACNVVVYHNMPAVKVFATQVVSMNAFESNFTYYYISTVNVQRGYFSRRFVDRGHVCHRVYILYRRLNTSRRGHEWRQRRLYYTQHEACYNGARY